MVTSYCSHCRRVLDPDADLRVPQSVFDEDNRYDRTKLAIRSLIGSPGPWKRLFLPEWDSVIERRGVDGIPRRTLFEDYSGVSRHKREELVRHHLKLNRGKATQILPTPQGIVDAHVNGATVKHLLDEFYTHRQGASHLRYLPLVARTVADPFEIWESSKATYERGVTLLFFRPYLVATGLVNHMVVVAERTGWIVTAFCNRDEDRDRERDGVFRHAHY